MLETELTARLRRHVERLAGEFGERHVFRPQALHAAEDYLREVWTGQGGKSGRRSTLFRTCAAPTWKSPWGYRGLMVIARPLRVRGSRRGPGWWPASPR
jgi:hypothetical protein